LIIRVLCIIKYTQNGSQNKLIQLAEQKSAQLRLILF